VKKKWGNYQRIVTTRGLPGEKKGSSDVEEGKGRIRGEGKEGVRTVKETGEEINLAL